MIQTINKKNWALDIAKTEEWLNQMNADGYSLQEATLSKSKGKFVFADANSESVSYKIGYGENNMPNDCKFDEYKEVCRYGKYFILRTKSKTAQIAPSLNDLWDKNTKQKFAIGAFLFSYLGLFSIIFPIFFVFAIISLVKEELEIGGFIVICVTLFIFSIPIFILSPKFIRLGKINKSIESLCGNPSELSKLVFQNNELSKADIKLFKKENKYIKKYKLGWQTYPDKVEKWLEEMEKNGFNLIKVSRLGASFYFIKENPRKIKYYADFQNKINLEYFNLHKENGWKLYFTYGTRMKALCIWGQEYTNEPPIIYNDKQAVLKHAKNIALTYSFSFLLLCAVYALMLALSIKNYNTFESPFISFLVSYPIMIWLYFIFTKRAIAYYFRIKKSLKNHDD